MTSLKGCSLHMLMQHFFRWWNILHLLISMTEQLLACIIDFLEGRGSTPDYSAGVTTEGIADGLQKGSQTSSLNGHTMSQQRRCILFSKRHTMTTRKQAWMMKSCSWSVFSWHSSGHNKKPATPCMWRH